jgi:hypothetical protein
VTDETVKKAFLRCGVTKERATMANDLSVRADQTLERWLCDTLDLARIGGLSRRAGEGIVIYTLMKCLAAGLVYDDDETALKTLSAMIRQHRLEMRNGSAGDKSQPSPASRSSLDRRKRAPRGTPTHARKNTGPCSGEPQ